MSSSMGVNDGTYGTYGTYRTYGTYGHLRRHMRLIGPIGPIGPHRPHRADRRVPDQTTSGRSVFSCATTRWRPAARLMPERPTATPSIVARTTPRSPRTT